MRSFAHALHRIAAVAAILVVTAALPGVSAAQPLPGLDGIDHYKVYRIGNTAFLNDNVTLIDQFGARNHNINGPRFLGVPANKNGEGIFDPGAHYTWYDINSEAFEPPHTIQYRNQFGQNDVVTQDARFLLTPARKNAPVGLPLPIKNHYKCYNAQGPGPFVNVTLQTQFGVEQVQVGPAVLWCNPADKLHQGQNFPMVNPNAHFVCYEILPPTTLGQNVLIRDQFLPFDRDAFVLENRFLCVPTILDNPTPAEGATWGRVKAQYRI